MSKARQIHQIDGPFKMQHGTLSNPCVAYETWGDLNRQQDNTILLFTGLSPSAHAASSDLDQAPGWWEQMIGPGRPIDTSMYFVVCINSLGSCFGSSGPASINPETGQRYDLDFPVLTLEDIAKAGHEVILSLGLTQLHAVVGASMGGMIALAYSVIFPDFARALVSISSAARCLPYSISLRSLQREMIRTDPDWKNGNYDPDQGPDSGMRLARKLGMLTYRSPQEFEQRFGREPTAEESDDSFGINFEVEAYLESHANKFVGSFDANCYLYLSRAMDLFDLADHGGSLANGFERVGANRALIVGVKTDVLFPISQQKELAKGLENGSREITFVSLPSIQGHDSFLVDMDRFRPILCDFFNCSMNQPGKLKSV
ncbi:MAG: homoserine O-acetyltransferase [Pseudomonadales bacterium]|nr:homoserine O-acetyltransferase [Pseudomonadales bacterium]